jgi:SAM-dependent methyltransferase
LDDFSDPIEAFYNRHPYPPPVTNLDRARDEWRDPDRGRAEYHVVWPDEPYRRSLDILVAGCGTWQAARYALTHPEARVVGIDVSTTSLEHTERLKAQYALTTVETHQLAIERVAALGRRFDLIVCTGVLHHLADPDAGLSALRNVLEPGGAMHLMVYGRYGRTGISMLQEYCRAVGVGTSGQEIRDLVATLAPVAKSHPAAAHLRDARDFRHSDALADALLNPRERSYSVPDLFEFLERNGCSFGRWLRQAPYLPTCGAIATTPHALRLAALPEREQYAAMELWRGSIATHSLLARRDDEARPAMEIRGDSVPIRLPYTVCVEERLPPGAAGVLLNRSHQHTDLILPIDARQKRLFDAIDGRRTVAEIGGDASFFETLWRYDQVTWARSPGLTQPT